MITNVGRLPGTVIHGIVLVGVALLGVNFALAQVTGRLSGIVQDSSGAPVGGAVAVLSLADSSIEDSSTVTSQAGIFVFPALRPTFYSLAVEAPGFARRVVSNIKIDPAAETSLPPLQLDVAARTDSVDVASEQMLQTATAEVTSTATYEQVSRLPLLGRDPLNVLDTLPGVSWNGRTDRTIDGQSVTFANITFDGVNVQQSFIRASSLQSTTLGLHTDQMNEATIVTVNPSAIYGGGSSQVAFSSKSGTNSFHGAAYWLNIPGGISSQYWLDNRGHTPSALKLNQIGATLGGPLKKDKLFFFLNFESDRDRSTLTRLATVPGTLPSSQDPLVQRVLALVPGPNSPGEFNYRGTQNDGSTTNLGLARLDYVASPKHSFGLTFSMNDNTTDIPSVSSPFGRVPTTSDTLVSPFAAASWRWSSGASFTNEVRAGGNRPSLDFHNSLRSRFPFLVELPFLRLDSQPMLGTDPQGRNDFLYNYQDNLTYVHGRHSLQAGSAVQQYRLASYGINRGPLDSLTVPFYLLNNGLGVSTVVQTFNIVSATSGYVKGSPPADKPSANLISGYFQDNWRLGPRFALNLGVRYDYLSPVTERSGNAIIPILSGSDAATAVYNPGLAFGFASKGRSLYQPDRNNFGPYLGFAWRAGDRVPLVIRGGYSISYVNDDLLRTMSEFAYGNPFQSSNEVSFPQSATLQSLPAAPAPPAFPPGNFTLSSLSTFGNGTVAAVDPRLRTPFVQQANLGIETEAKGFQFAARYVGNRLEKGLRSVNRNQPMLPTDYLATFRQVQQFLLGGGNPNQATGFPKLLGHGLISDGIVDTNAVNLIEGGQAGELARYYQDNGYNANSAYNFFGNPLAPNGIDLLSNLGRSRYDALQLAVTRRLAIGLNLTANYVFSKTRSNLDDYVQGAIDPYLDLKNPKQEWAPSPFNLTHAFKATTIYDLPLASRIAAGSFAGKVLGGWSVSGILIDQSGAPFSLLSGLGTFTIADNSGQNSVYTTQNRSQIQSYFGIRKSGDGTVSYVNNAPASAFQDPSPGTLGNLQRRSFNGPGTFNLNLGIRKVFAFGEQARLEFRGEAINVLNTVNWLVGDQTYQGTVNGSAAFDNNIYQWTPPRTIQFHMRVSF
jgi:hypothetical protein